MSGMKVLRTPEDRFADLPDFGYPPRYAEVDGLRLAYVETGEADGEPVLLLHGEPSWSFLYRKVMPAAHGRRAACHRGGPSGVRPLRQAGRDR